LIGPLAESSLFTSAGDAPLSSVNDDRLGRWKFAKAVYQLLVQCPNDWPVRVALLAGWGEGKTTIAQFVEFLANEDNHLVIKYSVSAATAVDDLWAGFAVALCKAIREAIDTKKLPASVDLASCKNLERNRFLNRIGSAAHGAGGFIADGAEVVGFGPIGKLFRTALAGGVGWMQRELGIDAEAVSKIRAQLGQDARIIVILDDLDRTEPTLVPELLLRLRDLLNIGGFSFLVPFDDTIIRRTLEDRFVVSGQGERFLEKIFDFEVYVPTPPPMLRIMFLEQELARHLTQLPYVFVHGLKDLLPASPRRIKSLVRHLYLYRNISDLIAEQPVIWWDVSCLELLRQVDHECFDQFRRELELSFAQGESVESDPLILPIGADSANAILRISRKLSNELPADSRATKALLVTWALVHEVLTGDSLETTRVAVRDLPTVDAEAIALSWRYFEHSKLYDWDNFREYIRSRGNADKTVTVLLAYRESLIYELGKPLPSATGSHLFKAFKAATITLAGAVVASYATAYDQRQKTYHNKGIDKYITAFVLQFLIERAEAVNNEIFDEVEEISYRYILERSAESDDFEHIIRGIEEAQPANNESAKRRVYLLRTAEEFAVRHIEWRMLWREAGFHYPIEPSTTFAVGSTTPQLFKDLLFSPESALWHSRVWQSTFFAEKRLEGESAEISQDLQTDLYLVIRAIIAAARGGPIFNAKDRGHAIELIKDKRILEGLWKASNRRSEEERRMLLEAGGDPSALALTLA
jgi:hypothetical protein